VPPDPRPAWMVQPSHLPRAIHYTVASHIQRPFRVSQQFGLAATTSKAIQVLAQLVVKQARHGRLQQRDRQRLHKLLAGLGRYFTFANTHEPSVSLGPTMVVFAHPQYGKFLLAWYVPGPRTQSRPDCGLARLVHTKDSLLLSCVSNMYRSAQSNLSSPSTGPQLRSS
jgi:hypothetical protein